MIENTLIAGSTGGVGRQIVSQLLVDGLTPRLLVRDEERARPIFGDRPVMVAGDTRDPASLAPALEGIHYVICATGSRTPIGGNRPEKVDYEGVRNLATAARAAGVLRFVLVSSIAVTRPDHPLNQFGRVLDWKLKGENALRESGLEYTIIRPGGLTDEPAGKTALKFDQGDRISGQVSRADVARVCIAALENPAARNVTFEMIALPGEPPQTTLGELFASLEPDR